MIIEDQYIETTISNNRKHYKLLGYGDCKQGTTIFVHINHLKPNSNLKVEYRCDHCSVVEKRQYQLLFKNNLHLCYTCSRKHVGKTMDRTNIDKATRERSGKKHHNWNANLSEFRKYSSKVHQLSEKTYKEHKDLINPLGIKRTLCGVEGGYQLDHIVSIKEGFDLGLSPEQMSQKDNLQMLSWKENRQKWFKKQKNIQEKNKWHSM